MRQHRTHAFAAIATLRTRRSAKALPKRGIAGIAAAGLLAVVAALCAGCAQRRVAEAPLQSWGYAAWWLPSSPARLHSAPIDRLLFFEIALAADGSIANTHGWPEDHRELRQAAVRRGMPLDVVLTLHGAKPFEALFSDASARERMLANAEDLARDPDVAGVQLDVEVYEPVSEQSVAGLRATVPQLAARLRAMRPRRALTLFIPPEHTGLYDRAAVAHADWAVMQAYDAHWAQGPEAGPVAPLRGRSPASWEQASRYAQALGLPRDRTLLSYPLYGYEWPMPERRSRGLTAGPGRVATLAPVDPARLPLIRTNVRERVERYGCARDARDGSASYLFLDPQSGWVAGWYEGAWSLQRKRRFLIENRLAGVAFFALGYDDFELIDRFERRRDRAIAPSRSC